MVCFRVLGFALWVCLGTGALSRGETALSWFLCNPRKRFLIIYFFPFLKPRACRQCSLMHSCCEVLRDSIRMHSRLPSSLSALAGPPACLARRGPERFAPKLRDPPERSVRAPPRLPKRQFSAGFKIPSIIRTLRATTANFPRAPTY